MTIDFLPELVGSMSTGAAGNPTVAVMEAAFRHHGLHWRYVNMEVPPDLLGVAVAGARAMGFRGFNCSIPHKQAVVQFLDDLTPSAELSGAVNCVMRGSDGRFTGTNTDGLGFLRALRDVIDPHGTNVVVLGAGGAARAVAVELALAGATRMTVCNRTLSAADDLARVIRDATSTIADAVELSVGYGIPERTDIVVNATSVGLYEPDTMVPIDMDTISDQHVVADVVFNPIETSLLRASAARGAQTINGLAMLVHQAAEAVRLWTGVDPDFDVMETKLREVMGLE
ncbi:MAG: shikimate dehydrogenase [Ilumatobacteraceae bacterium]